jgi:hypothetical protein
MTVMPEPVMHTAEIMWRREEARLVLGMPDEPQRPGSLPDLILVGLRFEAPAGLLA